MRKQHLSFGRDVKPRVLLFNEAHNLKLGIEQVVRKDKPGYDYPVWFNGEKIYGGSTLDGANAAITGVIKAYGCQISVDNSYVVESPFNNVQEKIDFLQAELDHQVELVKELSDNLHRTKALVANVHKMTQAPYMG